MEKKRQKKLAVIPGSETSPKRRGTNTLGNHALQIHYIFSGFGFVCVGGPQQDLRSYLFLLRGAFIYKELATFTLQTSTAFKL
jgi:hypothetical protein